MADNTLQNGTELIATDELSTLNDVDVSAANPRIKAQRVKVLFGDDGSARDVSLTRPLPVAVTVPSTATTSQVASAASVTTLAAANTSRRGLSVFNDSTADLYLKRGSGASLTSFSVKVPAGGFYELPFPHYTGVVTGIWSAANGNAYVTEDA